MDNVKISAFAKTVKRPQVGLVSSNIANTVAIRKPENGSHEPKDAMFAVVSMENPHSNMLDKKAQSDAERVEVLDTPEDQNPSGLQYGPDHLDANFLSYVARPNVNVVKEMIDMKTVTRAYEANVAPEKVP